MSGDDSSLSLRAPARETVFRPFPLASPSSALYIERMFFLRPCINQSVHYLRLYRSLYSNTLARVHLLFIRDLPLEFEGPRERHLPHFRSVRVMQPFHSAGVRFLCRDLRPIVGLLVACDSLTSRAPLNLNDDSWPSPAQRGNVLPRLQGGLLPRARFVRSSDAIRLMAACASVKILTRSGVVFLLAPIPIRAQLRHTLGRRPPG